MTEIDPRALVTPLLDLLSAGSSGEATLKMIVDEVKPTLWASLTRGNGSLEAMVTNTVAHAIAERWFDELLVVLTRRYPQRSELAEILEAHQTKELAARPEPTNRPVELERPIDLHGRDREFNELRRALVDDRENLVVVCGLPGIGKTTLVEEFCRHADRKGWFPGKIVIDRAGAEDLDRQVTAQRTYPREFPDTVFDGLPDKRSLLVFDNVDDRADILKILDRRKQVSRDVAILLTSITTSTLPPDSGARVIEVAPLADEHATALITKWADEARGLDDAGALQDAVRWAGGIPLLLRAVAGHLTDRYFKDRQRSWRQIIDRLLDQPQEPGDRYAKLFERIDRILRHAPQARSLLLAATLFHSSGFPISTLYQVAGIPPSEDEPLHRLHQLGLVRCIEPVTERWAVHSYMHKLASEAFSHDADLQPERAQQRHRFLAAMTDLLFARAGFDATRSHEASIRRAFDDPSDEDIAYLWGRFRKDRKQIEFAAVNLVLSAAQRRKLWYELLQCAYRSLPSGASSEGDVLRGMCLLNLGKAQLHDQHLNEAKGTLAVATRELRRSVDTEPRLLADALLCQSDVQRADNEVDSAITSLNEALGLLTSDPREQGSCHRKLSMCYERVGDFRSAHRHIQQALEIHETQSNGRDWTNDIAYDSCRAGTIELHLGRADDAADLLKRAVDLHTRKVGPESAFVAYDLNRLGQAELARGNVDAALGLQLRARAIHSQISGRDSTEVAIDALRLAEAYLQAERPVQARGYVNEAGTIYERRRRTKSPHFGYVQLLAARVALVEKRFVEAAELAEQAVTLVSQPQRGNIHRPLALLVQGQVLLAEGKAARAVEVLFEARDGFAQFGMLRDFEMASTLLDAALLRRDTTAWNNSAVEYAHYLERFSDGLHGRVAEATVELLQQEYTRTSPPTPGAWVIDLCCGTGILSAALERAKLPVNVLGMDCPAMVAQAEEHLARLAPAGKHRFLVMDRDWRSGLAREVRKLPGRVLAVHLGLAIFQFGVRERHLLLQAICDAVDPGTLFLISTYAADFHFPDGCGEASRNEVNPFKEQLFAAWKRDAWTPPRTSEQALRPVFPKDSIDGLRHLLATHGFTLETTVPRPIRVERTGADRVAFSRLEAISEKLFGRRQPEQWWTTAARYLASYSDVTWATVLQARRTSEHGPTYVFLPPWTDARVLSRIEYTAAVAIQGRDHRTLFAKRGAAARDFRGAWSLPSAKADTACSLESVLRERLAQTLALSDVSLKLVAIRPALRTAPDGKWVNNLCVYEGESEDVAKADGKKYSEIAHLSVEEFLARQFRSGDNIGDCVKAYWDWVQLEYASTKSRRP